jgi:hypothetical protein
MVRLPDQDDAFVLVLMVCAACGALLLLLLC